MRPPFETFKNPICKGSIVLGSACGNCERCAWEEKEIARLRTEVHAAGAEEYIPVPVSAARDVAQRHKKSIVILAAWDAKHKMLHVTTYGESAQEKASAAVGGELVRNSLGAPPIGNVCFEDYRLEQARKLLEALKSLTAVLKEAFEAWDADKDSRCGKLLRAMFDSSLSYRDDISEIHKAIAEGEKFLGVTA